MAWRDLWNIVRNKSEKPSNKPINHVFSDEERELSAELRALKLEKAKILAQMDIEKQKIFLEKQKLELEDLKAELNGDDDDEQTQENNPNSFNPESILMALLMKSFVGGSPPNTSGSQQMTLNPYTQGQQQGQTQEVVCEKPQISDDEIRNFLKGQNKNHLKMAKILPKVAVFRMVTQQIPLTESEFERAYKIMQEEF